MNKAAFDPGKKGALAISNGVVMKLPFLEFGRKTILDWEVVETALVENFVDEVFIEDVHSCPKDGVAGSFTFGAGWGQLVSMCQSLRIKFHFTNITKWKRYYKLIGKDKKANIFVCKQHFPNISLRPGRCTTDQDGMADALLILKYEMETRCLV